MTDTLAPYPQMRASGLDWLGDIPAHWEVRRAKYSFFESDERSETGEEELLSVSHKTGVTPRSQKNVTMFKAESYIGHKLARPGDIAVNTMWAWMAALGVSRDVGIVSPSYGVYLPRPYAQFEGRFLDYLLRTELYRAEYIRRSRGITVSVVWTARLFQLDGVKFHGSRSSMRFLGCPAAIASRVALR